jgi:hypothetical protein
MSAESIAQHSRGVLCRHCGKPVRVPKLVLRKESARHEHAPSDEMQFQLISRVFVLRCRSCEKESIYSIDQIVDCTFAQPPASARAAHTAA